MTVREQLFSIALERGLRETTVRSYEILLTRMGLMDKEAVSPDELYTALFTIDNPNTRRAAVIACRAVLGVKLKIPKAVGRKYNLPDEDTLRLALMTSPHEIRGLMMMYGGLRIGESCATTGQDVLSADKLAVTRQVVALTRTGLPTEYKLGPVKGTDGEVTIPYWLADRIRSVDEMVRPASVRESLRRAGWKVGINLNPHMLRHWYATTLLNKGVALKLVSKQMRHSDVSVTLRTYQQVDEGDIHRAWGETDV